MLVAGNGAMSYEVKLHQFEGPLNLLLELIESEELDISELSLGTVTDSFIKYLDATPDIPPEDLTDFLVVATKLLLIKSKLLLPFLHMGDADDEEQDLESQLKIFKQYLEASLAIEKMIGKRRFLYVHEKLPKIDIGFSPPKKFDMGIMEQLFTQVIKRLEPIVIIPTKKIIEKNVSIHDKIKHIRTAIEQAEKVSFSMLIEQAETRTEIIVSFLALLELVKQRSIVVSQAGKFDEITISKATAPAVQA